MTERGSYNSSDVHDVCLFLNLKSNVVITGGDGTKENPFTLVIIKYFLEETRNDK